MDVALRDSLTDPARDPKAKINGLAGRLFAPLRGGR